MLSAMTRIVTGAGFSPLPCSSAADVQRVLSARVKIDAAVVDVVLGSDSTGFGIERMLRAARLDCPVIYVSGYPNVRLPISDRSATLDKPFTPRELTSAIEAALAQTANAQRTAE